MALTPNQLANIPTSMVTLFQQLEDFIIKDIARQLIKAGKITDNVKWQTERTKEMGVSLKNINKEIERILLESESETRKMFEESASTSMAKENEVYELAGLTPVKIKGNPVLEEFIEAAIKQTKSELVNITNSLGFVKLKSGKIQPRNLTQFYQETLDLAHMKIISGTTNADTAIRQAIKSLASSGVRYIDYNNGWSNRLDVAVRRATLTGVNQMTQKMTIATMEELECEYVETSAHAGARPDHAEWQGQVFIWKGKSRDYPNFEESTKYGRGDGLGGWNCRHSFFPFFPGVSKRAYTDSTLKDIDPKPFEYENKIYTYYEAQQRQRRIETSIREKKRELIGYQASGLKDDFNATSIVLRELKDEYNRFSNIADLKVKNELIQVYGFDRSIAQKARNRM